MAFPSLEITTRIGCPNACRVCPQDKLLAAYMAGAPRMMDMETFKRCIETVPRDDVYIDFAGFCEPFANPLAPDMMLEAKRQGRTVYLHTTLIGLDPARWPEIRDVATKVCLHLPDADGVCKFPITERYYRALEAVAATPPRWLVAVTLGHDGKAAPEVAHVFGGRYPSKILDRATNVEGSVARHKPAPVACPLRYDRNVLLPNGDVYLCCMDWSLEAKVGNLLKQSWAELEQRAYPLCEKCEWSVPQEPLVSIVTSAYNAAEFLPETAQALFSQTYQNWEWVLYDDGGNEPVLAMVGGDPRVRVIRGPHIGYKAGWTEAYKASKGQFVCMMDADDLAAPNRLAVLVKEMQEHPELAAVSSGAEEIALDGAWVHRPCLPFDVDSFRDGHAYDDKPHPCMATLMYRGEWIERAGPLSQSVHDQGADAGMLMRVMDLDGKIGHVLEAVYVYRRHAGSQTFNQRPNHRQRDEYMREVDLSKYRRALKKWEMQHAAELQLEETAAG